MVRTGVLACFVLAASALLTVSCSGGGAKGAGGKGGVCPLGAETCACFGNETCDAGLICASGLCVRGGGGGGPGTAGSGAGGLSGGSGGIGACVAGAEACACYGNNTCDVGLTCSGGLCARSGAGGTTGTAGRPGGAGTTGGGGSGAACPTGAETCACYGNGTCNAGLSCASSLCVKLGGAGGTSGTGSGGAMGPGTGGVGPATDTCNNATPATIDNFATCDMNACDVGGKHGSWFGYADNGINLDFAVRVPPSAWKWRSCSAVVTGGPLPSGSTVYAGIGVTLNWPNAYDCSGYTGVRFRLESDSPIWVGIEQTDGGRFGVAAPASNAVIRDVSFASMTAQADSATATKDLRLVKQVVFSPQDPSVGFGFLIGEVSLY